MTDIGGVIRAIRESQNLSLQKLAELSDSSPSYISQVERGRRTPSKRWLRVVKQALAENYRWKDEA